MAEKGAVFGIKSLKFATPVAGGFPTSWEGFDMKAIVKDSVTYQDSAAGESNIEVEDMDEYYAILETDKGTKGFQLSTYDLSAEAYKFFMGYTNDETWNTESVGFKLEDKAVQIITKDYGDIKSRTFEWAKMKITVTQSGTIGKSGFPNLTLSLKKVANVDASGAEKAGARWKFTA